MTHQKKAITITSLFLFLCTLTTQPNVINLQRPINSDRFAFTLRECFSDCAKDLKIDEFYDEEITRANKPKKAKKHATFVVYMAADNDLYPFAYRNIEQMKQIGSNNNINIIVHLDMHRPGTRKVTRHLYIAKNKVIQIGKDMCLDSGNPETLIQTLNWAIDNYPSDILILDLWNHGSGDLNPFIRRAIDPSKLFYYNAEKNVIELDRSITFLDYIRYINSPERGICFDETYGTYLNDQKLVYALDKATKHRKKKIDVVVFDACLMAGTGTAWIMHNFANYMVASEEVSLGPGYDYRSVLQLLSKEKATARTFAQHVVACFKETYHPITNDFTQSALELSEYPALAANIDLVAKIICDAIKQQKNKSVTKMITKSRSRGCCTHFSEPSYIDLWNLFYNLKNNAHMISLRNSSQSNRMQQTLKQALILGLEFIDELIIANEHGSNHKHAHGITIYLPENKMHGSYTQTEFAKNNNWLELVKLYLKTR